MKTILFKRAKEQLTYNGKTIWAWNKVRSLANKRRLLVEVVFSEPITGNPMPYDPKLFPLGTWDVYQPVAKDVSNKYLHPFFIPTTAKQTVTTYSTADGMYLKPIGTQMDGGYGIHFSTSDTTLGCIRVAYEKDLIELANWITDQLRAGEKIQLTVME